MKNFESLFHRGIKYNLSAAFNWNRRRARLAKHVWQTLVKKAPTSVVHYKKKRIDKMILSLDNRIKKVIAYLQQESQKQKETLQKIQPETLILHCSNPVCQNDCKPETNALIIKSVDYTAGLHKCKSCGYNLITKQDAGINLMLFNMGILLPEKQG